MCETALCSTQLKLQGERRYDVSMWNLGRIVEVLTTARLPALIHQRPGFGISYLIILLLLA